LEKQIVKYQNLGLIGYKAAWELQEQLLLENLDLKTEARNARQADPFSVSTQHHLLFCEHHPVYTLGKSGDSSNVLLNEEELMNRNIEFFRTNRGGDITFHGPGQIVGYPIFDLEKFTTDIGVYLRNIEEVVIKVLSLYGINGYRSKGETGVWLDPDVKGRERKICAIGVRCSRWITMHGFALNVNTGMDYFSNIVPCGIPDKQVTSLSKELGVPQDMELVRTQLKSAFQEVFQIDIQE
jgi:lipoyl(octanoyl) transferase